MSTSEFGRGQGSRIKDSRLSILQQFQREVVFDTDRMGFTDITDAAARWLDDVAARDGLLTVFIRHTSASLTIQENADPAVQRDLSTALDEAAPESERYEHASEGPDDMPAHIKAMLTSTSLQVPVQAGRMLLGTWQALYLIEHRRTPHQRKIALHFIGTVRSP
ncbi:MAG: secondary thiamine-phosphate synthase enzyme YjbQ [Hyphomicrobiaceae bacterium]